MFNKHIHSKFFVAGAFLASLGLASCVDNDYDLDNVDLTIGSDVDLTLPTSSTGEILLKNLIDLKEDGVVQLVPNPTGEGEMYVVCEDGVANIDPISIGEIKVSKPTVNDFDSKVNLLPESRNARHKVRNAAPHFVSVNVSGFEINLGDATYDYELKVGEASTNIENAVAADVSSDICALEMIKCTPNSLTLKLSVKNVPDHFGNLHLDNFRLTLPAELHINSCTIDGVSIPSLTDIDNSAATQTLQLTPGTDVVGRSMNDVLTLTLGFDQATIFTATAENPAAPHNNVVFDSETGDVTFSGSLSVLGTFRVEMSEMNKEKLQSIIDGMTAEEKSEIYSDFVNGTLDLRKFSKIIPASLQFNGKNSFADDIRITNVTGEFKHEVGAIDPIKLNDLPDFLNDPEVVLDLDNPMVFISTSTTLPAEAKTSIKLISKVGANSVLRSTDEITLSGSKVFWMANREEKLFVPEKYTKTGVNLLYTPLFNERNIKSDVTGLIKTIPDQIDVEVAEVRLKALDLDITKSYDVNVDYQIYAPLTFGPEFSLVYQDTETDFNLGEDLDDLSISQDAVIEVDAQVVSTLPTKCSVSIIPLNKEKEVISIVKPITLSVGAHANGEKIHAQITPIAGHSLEEILHSGVNQLDGIKYKAVLDEPVPEEALTDKGNIVIKNIKIHVKSLVSYDAN